MNESIRSQFPSLKRRIKGKPCIYLDGPAGTQVPEKVIRSMSNYYRKSNANTHGKFAASVETDRLMSETRSLCAKFLGAKDESTISFGQNMTSLNYSLSHALARVFQPGDEILITQLDHEANRGPWLSLRQKGIHVREVRLLHNGQLDYQDLADKINERTRLLCIGWASNILGTVNNLELAREITYKVGAYLLVDAVHYAPHFPIDVTRLGCDFLLCSAYKFYGPHVGMLYSRPGLLDRLPTDRLRTTIQRAPYSIETGTLNHAAIAGVKSAIEFIANQGVGQTIKDSLYSSFQKIQSHEKKLAAQLYDGIEATGKCKILGPNFENNLRAPTISFIHEEYSASEVCQLLAAQNVYAWAGHFYAIRAAEILGVQEKGGVTRMGMSIYTSEEDVLSTIDFLTNL